ncbi:MAG TPA: M20/M25/M40 family metallo-hydrolase [Longimicrobiales bacterium]|nr:M20/M25/M40 family metallo-hydrolase [Longimicrobiales bacterium]
MRRLAPAFAVLAVLAALAACSPAPDTSAPDQRPSLADEGLSREQRLRNLLGALADDSMMGRRTGTEGAAMAARFVASELERYGVQPAGESGYAQPVPLGLVERRGRLRPALPSPDLDLDTLPPGSLLSDEVNLVGIIPGTDPTLREEAVIIGAHFDHVGVGPAVDGDSIYNGADDDGSGTVAILEIARELVRTPTKRTLVILLSTGEEVGILGTRWYLEHPVFPLDRTVADLQIEMIARPDSLAGGPGHAWLTGYERTTMGDQLAAAGSPIVPDPRPDERFFFRSDNLPFAQRGIPAHTLSSYNMHGDYHTPADDIDGVDFEHMAAVVDAAVQAVRFLADGPKPEWKEGGRDGLTGGR